MASVEQKKKKKDTASNITFRPKKTWHPQLGRCGRGKEYCRG